MTEIEEIKEQVEVLDEQYDKLDEEMYNALHELEDVSEAIEKLKKSDSINSDLLESLITLLVSKNIISIPEMQFATQNEMLKPLNE